MFLHKQQCNAEFFDYEAENLNSCALKEGSEIIDCRYIQRRDLKKKMQMA